MYIYIYIYKWIYIYSFIHVPVYIYIYTYTCIYICIYTYIHMHMCLHIYACTNTDVYINKNIWSHFYTHSCYHTYTCISRLRQMPEGREGQLMACTVWNHDTVIILQGCKFHSKHTHEDCSAPLSIVVHKRNHLAVSCAARHQWVWCDQCCDCNGPERRQRGCSTPSHWCVNSPLIHRQLDWIENVIYALIMSHELIMTYALIMSHMHW